MKSRAGRWTAETAVGQRRVEIIAKHKVRVKRTLKKERGRV